MIRGWLSRQRSGAYMLTETRPVLHLWPDGKGDLYVPYGDKVGYRNMCAAGAEAIWGIRLNRLQSCRVYVQGGRLDDFTSTRNGTDAGRVLDPATDHDLVPDDEIGGCGAAD